MPVVGPPTAHTQIIQQGRLPHLDLCYGGPTLEQDLRLGLAGKHLVAHRTQPGSRLAAQVRLAIGRKISERSVQCGWGG